jgi:beta-galactosidase
MCGFPKDNYYYYQAWWSDAVVLHILPHWNWARREGELIDVWVHSNCDAVELFLNGESLGIQLMPANGHLEWSVPYTQGVLVAKGYRDGVLIAEAEQRTTGAAAAIRLSPSNTSLNADGEDAVIVNVAVVDSAGLVVPTADNLIRFTLQGKGRIIGVGNGDPSCHEPDKAEQRSAFNGLCQVIVRATREIGEIVLIAESDGLTSAKLTLEASACLPRPYVPAVS